MDKRAKNLLRAWQLSDAVPLARTDTGLILRVKCEDGTLAVLKCLTELGRLEEGTAPAVLKAFNGSGAVHLLKADENGHLIEYCDGPKLLNSKGGHEDDVAMPVLIDVIRRLRSVVTGKPFGIPTLAERCEAIDRVVHLVDSNTASRFRRARAIADKLLSDQVPALLHGDMHHENVLNSHRSGQSVWLAIDPQGIWGDPAYEVANLFGNPLNNPEVTLESSRPMRLSTMLQEHLGLPRYRILGWAYIHSCISAAWSIEDGLDPSYRLCIADHITSAL